MSDDREKRPRPGGPGTTSDPNQSNREPARDRGAEQVREAPIGPVPGGPEPGERGDRRREPGRE
jgi:hypothetical protein